MSIRIPPGLKEEEEEKIHIRVTRRFVTFDRCSSFTWSIREELIRFSSSFICCECLSIDRHDKIIIFVIEVQGRKKSAYIFFFLFYRSCPVSFSSSFLINNQEKISSQRRRWSMSFSSIKSFMSDLSITLW